MRFGIAEAVSKSSIRWLMLRTTQACMPTTMTINAMRPAIRVRPGTEPNRIAFGARSGGSAGSGVSR